MRLSAEHHGQRAGRAHEGADVRKATYAKFGRSIVGQPDGIAFQVWDANVASHLSAKEFGGAGRIRLEELAAKCATQGLPDPTRPIQTVNDYNKAVELHRREHPDLQWNPAAKDGLPTTGLEIAKSNGALPLNKPPFEAFRVRGAVTF